MKRTGNYRFGKENTSYKHGLTRSPTHSSWRSMKYRATSSNKCKDIAYRKVGMCNEWYSFEKFLQDMGTRPSINHTIGRIDNSLGYTKENCRWETRSQQNSNKKHHAIKNKFNYRGVKLYKRGSSGKHYQASIRGKHIGYFNTPKEAAIAYNKKAMELFGNNALLNIIEELENGNN